MTYITKSDIELWFNEQVSLSENLADDLISKNSAYVDHISGTSFQSNSTTEYINNYVPTDVIRVSNIPIIDVTGVYVNRGTEFSPEYESVDFVIIDEKSGDIKLKEIISPGIKKVKVEYTYGYSTVPEIVKRLVVLLCVKDVLSIMLNRKSYDDEGDIDLGSLKVTNSFKYSLGQIKQLDEEIEKLKEELFGFVSNYNV